VCKWCPAGDDIILNCKAYNFNNISASFLVLAEQQMENADADRDIYDELLTQAEIQGNVNQVNGESRDAFAAPQSSRRSR